ncbi:MAG: hypothetical protein FJ100_02995 [Deltaproteobacteria bacterium]|nr:hypothetical protein [Deltaproteobacteria bacterium]
MPSRLSARRVAAGPRQDLDGRPQFDDLAARNADVGFEVLVLAVVAGQQRVQRQVVAAERDAVVAAAAEHHAVGGEDLGDVAARPQRGFRFWGGRRRAQS